MKKVKITNTDVAKAIAGSIKSNSLYPFMFRGFCIDLDTETENGVYDVAEGYSANIPKGLYAYGSLMVYSSLFTTQIFVPHRGLNNTYQIAEYGIMVLGRDGDFLLPNNNGGHSARLFY